MQRRTFLAGSLAILAAPLGAKAQQAGRVYRIGVLLPLGVTPPILATFLAGMRDQGWVENRGFVAEPRYAEGRLERLPDLAAGLVRLNVDVLVTMGTPATLAAKHATATIPIVFGLVGDAVGAGVVPNVARPGGNVTGMALYGTEVFGKGLELLKEAVPRAERVMITQPLRHNPSQRLADAAADTVAKTLGIRLHRVNVGHVADYEAAFELAVRERVRGAYLSLHAVTAGDRRLCSAPPVADDDPDGIGGTGRSAYCLRSELRRAGASGGELRGSDSESREAG